MVNAWAGCFSCFKVPDLREFSGGSTQNTTSLKDVVVSGEVPSSLFFMLTVVHVSVSEFSGYSKTSVTQSHSDLAADSVLALQIAFSTCSK